MIPPMISAIVLEKKMVPLEKKYFQIHTIKFTGFQYGQGNEGNSISFIFTTAAIWI